MKKSNKTEIIIIILLVLILASLIIYYLIDEKSESETTTTISSNNAITSTQNSDGTYNLDLDKSKWNYDKENNIYYQIGLVYCAKPETTDYESLGIYVPGDYFTSTENSDGTYTCKINTEKKVGNFTSETAPIVMPINTAGYSAQKAPTSYSSDGITDYLNSGFIYVYAGCRGRYDNNNTEINSGAPWGVTDLKAAIRFLRYNKNYIPADSEKIVTFGHSGGGAQSALLGATGNSELYNDYLNSIGAVLNDNDGNPISDNIYGAMCWCPITNLDIADEAYEWNIGQFEETGTREDGTFTKELSNDMSEAFAEYINKLGLKDENGRLLNLNKTTKGIYLSGTYYNYIVSQIETSLNNFLSDTEFPYTPSNNEEPDGGFGGGEKELRAPETASSVTYNTAQEYINSLNSDETWVTYNQKTNTARITGLEAFVKNCKSSGKEVGAFDSLDKSQPENKLFGNKNSNSLHFDSIMANLLNTNSSKYSLLKNWDNSYISSYLEDLENKDSLDHDVNYRSNMYNPMYYLSNNYEGYNTSVPAKYWRINTGIEQSDTANVTEINLELALKNNPNIQEVEFTTVWNQGHTTAERTGDSTTNFINWVNEIIK